MSKSDKILNYFQKNLNSLDINTLENISARSEDAFKEICKDIGLKNDRKNRENIKMTWKRKKNFLISNKVSGKQFIGKIQDSFAESNVGFFETNLNIENKNSEIDFVPIPMDISQNSSLIEIQSEISLLEPNQLVNNDFIVPMSFWNLFLIGNKFKKNWTDSFNTYFKIYNQICVLVFKWYRIFERKRKKNASSFIAMAHCKHPKCASFYFSTKDKLDGDVKISVIRKGEIVHEKGDKFRRFFKGEIRKKLGDDLEKDFPSTVKLKKLDEAPRKILLKGNLNEVPNLNILKKISSERIKSLDLDINLFNYLIKLQNLYREEVYWPGHYCNGYIQSLGYDPLSIILFTEYQLKLITKLSKTKNIFLYLDSTGSVIRPPKWIKKGSIYYYALVIPGHKKSPVPIAEFISSSHDIPSICYFLSKFIHGLKSVSNLDSNKIIKKIETDFSLALIQAVLLSVNKINLKRYLDLAYQEIFLEKDSFDELTLIHVCSAHVINNVKKRFFGFVKNKNFRIKATRVVAKIINSNNILKITNYLVHFFIVFGSEFKNKFWDKSVAILDGNRDTKLKFALIPNIYVIRKKSLKKGSPFFQYFSEIKDLVINSEEASQEINPFFNPKLTDYVLKEILAFYPIISGIMLKKLNLIRDSNCHVENWFKIVKRNIFKSKLRNQVPRFIMIMEKLLKPRLDAFLFSLESTKKKKKKKIKADDTIDISLVEEMWAKKITDSSLFSSYSKSIEINPPIPTSTPKKTIGKPVENMDLTPIKNLSENRELPCLNLETKFSDKILNLSKNFEDKLSKNVSSVVTEAIKSINPWEEDINNLLIDFRPGVEIFAKIITKTDYESLSPRGWITGTIVNSFLDICREEGRNNFLDILNFDTYFLYQLKRFGVDNLGGFYKWANKNSIMSKDIWLVPYNKDGNHWTLYIVILKLKKIVYIDSLHGDLEMDITKKFLKFLASHYFNDTKLPFELKDWQIFIPKDIPHQGNAHDCGVHVCLWGYIMTGNTVLDFDQVSMSKIRIWIRNKIMNFKSRGSRHRRTHEKNLDLLLTDDSKLRVSKKLNFGDLKLFYCSPGDGESTLKFLGNIKKSLTKATDSRCGATICNPNESDPVQWIFCDRCREWFHKSCARDIQYEGDKAYCGSCRD